METGEKDGKGYFIYANGDLYEGYWSKNKRNGKGRMIYSKFDKINPVFDFCQKQYPHFDDDELRAAIYEGYWKDGMFDGNGTYTFLNGEKYEGTWYQGKMKGYGKYTFKSGAYYIG